jgi:hypothetical protein
MGPAVGQLTEYGKLRPRPAPRTFPHSLENAPRFPQLPTADGGGPR